MRIRERCTRIVCSSSASPHSGMSQSGAPLLVDGRFSPSATGSALGGWLSGAPPAARLVAVARGCWATIGGGVAVARGSLRGGAVAVAGGGWVAVAGG